jgi:AraC family transcriptional regulator
MPTQFRHLRAQYYDEDPARARTLPQYHVREQRIAGLISTETRHPPQFRIPSHAHDLHSFYLVVDGTLTEFSDRARRDLPTQSVVFTPAGDIHRNTFHDAGGRCLLVEFTPEWAGHLTEARIGSQGTLVAERGEVPFLAIRLLRELRAMDQVSSLSIEGLTLEILASLARFPGTATAGSVPAWLREARDLLHDRFAERVTLAEIARQVDVHPVHLARTFRRRFRCSPGDYQRRLRVEHAGRQLSTTQRSLADIAAAAGFADQAHFSRVFKEHTGFTPARFRTTFGAR